MSLHTCWCASLGVFKEFMVTPRLTKASNLRPLRSQLLDKKQDNECLCTPSWIPLAPRKPHANMLPLLFPMLLPLQPTTTPFATATLADNAMPSLLYSSLLIRLAAPPPRILRPEILIKSFLSAAQIPIKILLRSARSIRDQTPAPYEMWARSADYANSRSKLFQNYKSKFIHNMSMLGLCNRRWNREWMWHVIKSKMWWFLCDVDNHT